MLLEAKELRNRIEHYEFKFTEANLRTICIDFLALCSLLAEKLLKISLVEAFSWDYLRDRPDKVATQLEQILAEMSTTGRMAARKAGTLWVERNVSRRAYLCLNCGARAVAADHGACMACGTEGDEDAAILIEELESASRAFAEGKEPSR